MKHWMERVSHIYYVREKSVMLTSLVAYGLLLLRSSGSTTAG